jgi:hypothetical protein
MRRQQLTEAQIAALFPGRPLRINERPPAALISLVANRSMFGQSPSTITCSLAKTAGVMLQNCRTERGVLKITPIEKSTPPEADALAALLYAMLPRIRVSATTGCSIALLGFQFAPRNPDLKSRRLYSFAKSSAYPTLEPLIAGRINVALIRMASSMARSACCRMSPASILLKSRQDRMPSCSSRRSNASAKSRPSARE